MLLHLNCAEASHLLCSCQTYLLRPSYLGGLPAGHQGASTVQPVFIYAMLQLQCPLCDVQCCVFGAAAEALFERGSAQEGVW